MAVWLIGDMWMATIGNKYESKLRSFLVACRFTLLVAIEATSCYFLLVQSPISATIVAGIYCLTHLYFGTLFLSRGMKFYGTIRNSVYAVESAESPTQRSLFSILADAKQRARWSLVLIVLGNMYSFTA